MSADKDIIVGGQAADPPCPNRLGNVLQQLRAKVVADDFELAAGFPTGTLRQANAAWLGNALQPHGDIDAVAEDVVLVENDVPHMDADAELDPSIRRHGGTAEFCPANPHCSSTALRNASTALANSTSRRSPLALMVRL